MGLMAALLGGCGGNKDSFATSMDAALSKVPGVVSSSTEYNNSAGMSTRINVRVTASPDADLGTVLADSLHAFAGASGSTRGTISVAFYVFAEGDGENGIRPDSLGLPVTPTVDEIRGFAG